MKLTQLQALSICNWFYAILVEAKPLKIDNELQAEKQFDETILSVNCAEHFKMELYRHLVNFEFNATLNLMLGVGETRFKDDSQLSQLVNQISNDCKVDWSSVEQDIELKVKLSGKIITRFAKDSNWKVIFSAFAAKNKKAKDKDDINESVVDAKAEPIKSFIGDEDFEGQISTVVQLQQEIAVLENKVKEHAKQLDGFTQPLVAILAILQQELTKCLQMKKAIAGQGEQLISVQQQRKNQEKFINTICHEVRNPLNGIYGAVDALNNKVQAIEDIFNINFEKLDKATVFNLYDVLNKLRKTASAIEKCANHQKMIVDEVLDLSKLENNKIELNPTDFCVQKIVKDIIKMFSLQIQQKDLKVKLNPPEPKIWIKADAMRLRQIIINLLSNAVKFTHEKGCIFIAVETEVLTGQEAKLLVTVQDTGIGLDKEEASKIFNEFAQASPNISTEYGGSGLGLAICKKLVEKMSGKISVVSQKFRGSEFRFFIKCLLLTEQEILVQMEGLKSVTTTLQDKSNYEKRTFLIVEDNLFNQKILARYLKQAGYFYQTANNGCEALEKYKVFKFDLIFMDVVMPVMNGIEATQKIREMEKAFKTVRTPIIGLSGNVSKDQTQDALNAGMDGYLNKPYRKEQIYSVIQEKLTSQSLILTSQPKKRSPSFVSTNVANSSLSTFFKPEQSQANALTAITGSPPVSKLGS